MTDADVHFISGMIGHHAQAIIMAGWAPTHGASASMRTLCERIINAQTDEIALMQRWLRDRHEPPVEAKPVPMKMMMNGVEHEMLMPGMLSDDQMKQLDAARGPEFDRLFLPFMIQHHSGAVTMVGPALRAGCGPGRGGVQDGQRHPGRSDHRNQSHDQDVSHHARGLTMKFKMHRVLAGIIALAATAATLSPVAAQNAPNPDPRVGLRGGKLDTNGTVEPAAMAAWNMRLLSNTTPPAPFLGKTNADLAFFGKYVIQGNYGGPLLWDISNPAQPVLAKTDLCPASQDDVSIFKNLLFVSRANRTPVASTAARRACRDSVSKDRMRGVRIFDISDINNPKYIANVQTCRGSHTHTVVTDPKDNANVSTSTSRARRRCARPPSSRAARARLARTRIPTRRGSGSRSSRCRSPIRSRRRS